MGRLRRIRRLVPDHADPASWLQRIEVARLLGVTRQSVWYLERQGLLHPRLEGPDTLPDEKRERRFDPAEVYAYAMTHPPSHKAVPRADGDIAAAAFTMFDEGVARSEVVKKLHITPERADALWAEYHKGDFETAERDRRERERREQEAVAKREEDRQRQQRLERTQSILGKLGGSATPTPRR